jgi:hypothetical protein
MAMSDMGCAKRSDQIGKPFSIFLNWRMPSYRKKLLTARLSQRPGRESVNTRRRYLCVQVVTEACNITKVM